jgi:DNA-binding transcriptional ArsR family regulator
MTPSDESASGRPEAPAPPPSGSASLIDVIAAIHHPVRQTLLELLGLHGPATVSSLAEAAHERVGNVSHHIKVLADAGLVEEAPELAKDRRERWWRFTAKSTSWSTADVAGDPVGELVAGAAEQQNLAHQVGRLQQWYGRRGEYGEAWIRAAFSTNSWISVNPDELQRFSERILELLEEYAVTAERTADPDRELVFVFAHGFPAKP